MIQIQIIGTGCPKCERMRKTAEETVRQFGLDAEIIHVSDICEIIASGVTAVPAMVVNGTVAAAGRVPNSGEMRTLIADAGA